MLAVTQLLASGPALHLLPEERGVDGESLVDLVLHGANIQTSVEGKLGFSDLRESCELERNGKGLERTLRQSALSHSWIRRDMYSALISWDQYARGFGCDELVLYGIRELA